MRLLVFGRAGQVARELAGPDTVCLGRETLDLAAPGAEAAIAAALDAHAPEAVINAAAWTAVDAAETEEDAAHRLNAEAPGAMARAAAARGLPLVHLSTDYVFDGAGTRPWRPGDAPAPLSAYGRTKLAGERAVAAAGGPHAILRTAWVFSAHGANFLRTMLRLGAERDELRVVEDQVGGPTPADAIAGACRAAAAALARDPGLSGVYHFSGTPETSWAGFAREIMARAGLGARVTGIPSADWPTPAPRPANSRLDCGATEAAFGVARPDWRDGIDRALAALRTTEGKDT